MNKHWLYLRYLIRHKYYVFIAGRRIGVSWWRLLKHDWTKFTPAEWFPYVEFFYGEWRTRAEKHPSDKRIIERFEVAWLHHQHWNDHHWQHWVLREDSGALKLLDIPDECIAEMVADWAGAGRAITGKWSVQDWYENNRDNIQLNPITQIVVDRTIRLFFQPPSPSNHDPEA